MAVATRELQKKGTSVKEAERTRSKRIYTPRVDIIERDREIVLIADMPGVDEKSVDITLEKDVLNVYGRVDEEIADGYRAIYTEYGTGDYERSFIISDEIDRDRIEAKVKNGVLTLILPKADAVKTRKIQVRGE